MFRSQSSSVTSTTGLVAAVPPALFTMMSIRPKCSTAKSTSDSMSSFFRTSPWRKTARSPAPRSATIFSPLSARRPLSTTFAPSRKKASAMPRPSPAVPPVMTAHTTTTRVVTLARRPGGSPSPEDFALEERAVPGLSDGQLLVRNAFMSVDPSMRGRLEETEKHYTTNFRVGEPLDGSALGRVLESRADGVPGGAWVRHRLGWRDSAVVEAAAATVVDAELAPPPHWLGVLGQTGFTAYSGLVRAGELREGDVVFVSAAAGAVGSAAGQLARL